MTTSKSEAQLFRRFRASRASQPQRYIPPNGYARSPYSQNGYQGQLTASPRTRPVYVRRADGSVVRYYPNNNAQVAGNQAKQPQTANPRPKLATTEGQLRPVRPQQQSQQRFNRSDQRPNPTTAPQFAAPQTVAPQSVVASRPAVAPVGVSVADRSESDPTAASISPATAMPQAASTAVADPVDPASSIPVITSATNPVPTGLSLSMSEDDNVVPASATLPVESPALNLTPPKSFSVLESIE